MTPASHAALAAGALVLVALPTQAHAQTSAQTGGWIDATPSLGLGGQPFGPSFGVRASMGWWRGNYDHGYLLGRAWGVGVAGRVDLFGPELRLAPSLEIRRTVDLLVVGYRWRLLVGPEWEGDDLGVGARVGGSLKVRPNRNVGPTLDAELGGAWVDGGFSPRFSVGVGVEVALSWSGREQRDPGTQR